MTRAAYAEIRILDMDEAKALVDRLKRMTRYAEALEDEAADLDTFDLRDDDWPSGFRARHGITDADMSAHGENVTPDRVRAVREIDHGTFNGTRYVTQIPGDARNEYDDFEIRRVTSEEVRG